MTEKFKQWEDQTRHAIGVHWKATKRLERMFLEAPGGFFPSEEVYVRMSMEARERCIRALEDARAALADIQELEFEG